MNNNLNFIKESIKLYTSNYVINNPNWDHQTLIKKIESRALMEAEIEDYELSKEDLSSIINISVRGLEGEMEDATYFEDNTEWTDWLSIRKKNKEIIFKNWLAYRDFLSHKPNWTQGEKGTLTKLDLNTERILSKLADPKGPSLVRKGMVVGNVQSGKTANYIGLISKAADAGYQVIVILAGMLNDLRIQTQIRVEEGFIGRNACNQELVGVGENIENPREIKKLSFTNREDDFKTKTVKAFGGYNFLEFEQTCIFVIKKNTTILKNLNKWLSKELKNNSISKADGSLLLIDDEADNASINTKAGSPYLIKKKIDKDYNNDEIDPSKINGQIRKLIEKFKVCTYVGYTATPFANIFISPKNKNKKYSETLFPEHFIQYIKPPSIYFGPSRIFVEKEFPKLLKYIPLDEINGYEQPCIPRTHKKDFRLKELPKSLKNAIHSFLIATSIRMIREQGIAFHSTMLVNPSTFTDVQISVKGKIQDYIEIANQLLNITDSVLISQIKKVWEVDFQDLHESNNWDLILSTIKKLIEDIKVVVVNNSRKSGSLEYEKFKRSGRKIIVVGGFSLSRGLTLEGLITSYYLRYSKMYDSMLQMGRWFGYRLGYEDLCKLYLSRDSHEDFEIISSAVEELSVKFEEMQAINATPMQFGLQIRADAQNKRLTITAKNKMGAAQKVYRSYSYRGRLVQNFCFEKNKISENLKAVDNFHSKLIRNFKENKLINSKYYGFRDVDGSLIFDLISKYHISELNDTITKDTLIKYLKIRLEHELRSWHIIFDSNTNNNSKNGNYNSAGVNIAKVGRQVTTKQINYNKTIFLSKPTSRSICSPKIAENVFTQSEIDNIEDHFYSKKMLSLRLSNKYLKPVLIIAFCNPTFNTNECTNDDESLSVKKVIESISTIASINFLFPYGKIQEELIQVWENAEITDLYGNDSYTEDGDD